MARTRLKSIKNTSNKRQRCDPVAVKSEGEAGLVANANDDTETTSNELQLEGISRFLMVDLQSDQEETVRAALDKAAFDVDALSELGAVAFLLLALKKWSHSEEIVNLCYSHIICIFENVDCATTYKKDKETFVALGGLELIVSAMKSAPESEELINNGMSVLDFIFEETAAEFQVEYDLNKKFPIEGIQVFLTAMNKHSADESLQRIACTVLSTLGEHSKEFQQALIDNGAPNVAARMFHSSTDGTSLQIHAKRLIDAIFCNT